MAAANTEALLHKLVDEAAIRDLASRYAHCVWRKDVEGAVSLFTRDAEMDTGDRPVIKGEEALREAYQAMITGPSFQPFVHNHLIELHGDTATGVCYLDLHASVEGKSMIGSGHYDDEYARIDGEWKFRSRKLRMDYFVPLREGWAESEEVGAAREPPAESEG